MTTQISNRRSEDSTLSTTGHVTDKRPPRMTIKTMMKKQKRRTKIIIRPISLTRISLLPAVGVVAIILLLQGVSSLSLKTPPGSASESNTATSWSAGAGESALRQVQFLASRASVSKLSTNDDVDSINERNQNQNQKYKKKYNDGTDSMFSSFTWRLDRARERRLEEKKKKRNMILSQLTEPTATSELQQSQLEPNGIFNNSGYNEDSSRYSNTSDDVVQQQQQQLQQQQQQLLQTSSTSNYNKQRQQQGSGSGSTGTRKIVTSSSKRDEQVLAALSNLEMDMNLLDNLAGQRPQLTVLELILLSFSVTAASASPWIFGGQLAEVLPPTAAACKSVEVVFT